MTEQILIATVPIAGHIQPLLPLAKQLVARGHSVKWCTNAKYRKRIEAMGAEFVPARHSAMFDDADLSASFPRRPKSSGISQLKYDIKHVFLDDLPGQLQDIREKAGKQKPKVIVCDAAYVGAVAHKELTGTPCVVIGVLPMSLGGVDVAPFGLGITPVDTVWGRMRNRLLHASVQHVLFADVQRHWNRVRVRAGMSPTKTWVLDASMDATLYLQPSVPSFEYRRRDMPHSARFVGAFPVESPAHWVAPEWWDEVAAAKAVVHVTQGTLANTRADSFLPALAGLANEDVLVVISTGGRAPEALGLTDVPANARIARFLSYPELLPRTHVMLSNGGYGGVQAALSHGVPVVVAGTTEDKPEVAARVAWSGAGINLRTATPSPRAVRDAVMQVLKQPHYRARAASLAAEYAKYDAVTLSVEAVQSCMARS